MITIILSKVKSMVLRSVVFWVLGFVGLAQAQTMIQAVSASVQGGAETLRIDLSANLGTQPTGFVTQSPARIALDFPGVVNGMGRSTVDINQGNLRSVSVVEAGERTRVVVNLKQAATYTTELQGNRLLVVLAPPARSGEVTSVNNSDSRRVDLTPLKDIDFRKTTEGAGRVLVGLARNQVSADIRQQGQFLVVDFLQSALPDALRQRLDVTDFGTPVKTVSTTQVGDRVRMVIEPTGLWEHSAYQTDDLFVVEVKAIKPDPEKLTQGVGFNGQKLSLNFQNIEVRSLLQVIADFTNFNIITSDSVVGSVTLRLQDVPWDQALDIILQAKGLGMRKNGNVIWVAPKDEIAAKEKLDLESAATVQSLEPLRTQSFQINYAKAADISAQLAATGSSTAVSARILSPRGSAIAEPRTNQLFVTDIPSKLEQVQQLIAKLDIAVRQVLIEARIVEADDNFSRKLGVRLGGTDLRQQAGGVGGYQLGGGENRVAFGANYSNVVATSGAGGTVALDKSFVNLPASSIAGVEAATFAVSLFSPSAQRFLNLEISALESDGKGKVVSSPRLVTSDQNKASIEQGVEIPYQKATSSGATAVEFKPATLKLEVTPQITPDGGIILNLNVAKDTPDTTNAGAVNTKRIQTQVLVENGGTVVIGGIYNENEQKTIRKVPFFGDIPIAGHLFRNSDVEIRKTEMLVFITPKILVDRSVAR